MTDTTTAISLASTAAGLFDKSADEVERFTKKRPEPDVPHEYRMSIRQDTGARGATQQGHVTERITGDNLPKVLEQPLDRVVVLERSMQNHYAVWTSAYPQLVLLDGPVQKARVEAQLGDVIRSMKSDLDGNLAFLESAGFELDDHYLNIRCLMQDY